MSSSSALGERLLQSNILGEKPLGWMRIGCHPSQPPAGLSSYITKGVMAYGLWASLAKDGDAPPRGQPLSPGDHGLAIARIGGDGTLYQTQDPTMMSHCPPAKGSAAPLPGMALKATNDIQFHALDRLIRDGALPSPDVIELDIPGCGAEALKGASWALRRSVCAVILRECHGQLYQGGSTFADADALLRDRGFTLFKLTSSKAPGGALLFAKALYLKADGDERRGLPNPGLRLRRGIVASLLGEDGEAQRLLGAASGEWASSKVRGAIEGAQEASAPNDAWAQRLSPKDPRRIFLSNVYRDLDIARRDAVLKSQLLVKKANILEVGAGVGQQSQAYLQADIHLTLSDARPGNIRILKERFPDTPIRLLDIERSSAPEALYAGVLCLGVLNHLKDPAQAIANLGDLANEWLLIESPIAPGPGARCTPLKEGSPGADGSVSGQGCLPQLGWLHGQLAPQFPYIYALREAPNHPAFKGDTPTRVMLLGSRSPQSEKIWSAYKGPS